MDEIELRIVCGRRLHFQLDVGCLHTYIPYRLRNKDRVLLRVLKELRWRVKELEGEQSDGCFDVLWTTFGADAEADVANALKALLKVRGLKKEEADELLRLPLKDLYRNLVLKHMLG